MSAALSVALPSVVFSHGNSFPASTYRVLLDSLRNRGFEVEAIEKFGHDPKYPVTDNWPHLVQQLADFAQQRADRAGGPVFLVGHSLGGFLSLMCAALHPALARGVVLIDSPILGGWRANTLNVVKRTPLMKSISPGAISRKRKNIWSDREAVFGHMEKLAANGCAILFISHRMDEVMRLSDHISVLRSGSLVRTFERGDARPDELLSLMAPEKIHGGVHG